MLLKKHEKCFTAEAQRTKRNNRVLEKDRKFDGFHD
jgi:hypothetical protein